MVRYIYYYLLHISCNSCRGENFRKHYSHLGELRSIIPEAVHAMALTATATKATRHKIIKTLCMSSTKLVRICPDKGKIKYVVKGTTTFGRDATIYCTIFTTTSSQYREDDYFIVRSMMIIL